MATTVHPSAIVDEGVEQAREAAGEKVTGFVNGLLRTLARSHPQGAWNVRGELTPDASVSVPRRRPRRGLPPERGAP